MTDADTTTRASMASGHHSLILPRLLIGLFQGFALYGLFLSIDDQPLLWPATQPEIFGPLALVSLYLPVILLGGLGRLKLRSLVIWGVVACALLAFLGWYDVARQALMDQREPFLSLPLFPFLAAALFIAHHLVVPADQGGRRIAPYPLYFDVAWKAGVQLALSVGFTGALWLLLLLGAGLFYLIGIRAFGNLLAEPWINLPLTSVTFALAVHLTDVRDGLIRGVRAVILMLLSWLLPVIAALTAAFLFALPFTGLSGLWAQGSATALMLAAAAVLIVLINAAYQDGTEDTRPPLVLRWAAIAGGFLLIPLIGVATSGLALRIGQYGLTPDRVIVAACILIGAAYAVGYGWAALSSLRRGDWMRPLERTNIGTGALAAVLVVLLFSPVLDPARLSVMDQMARLERGAVTPKQFDYRFLRFESGKAGKAALERLTKSKDAEVARRATDANELEDRWQNQTEGLPARAPAFEVVGTDLPKDFLAPLRPGDARYGCGDAYVCVARAIDLDNDGNLEILVARGALTTLWARDENGAWKRQASYAHVRCVGGDRGDAVDRLRSGPIRTEEPRWPALAFGDGPAVSPQSNSRALCPESGPRADADIDGGTR